MNNQSKVSLYAMVCESIKSYFTETILPRALPEPTQEEFARAHELAIDLKKRLPPEFTIKGRRYPALRFRADESVPGLYRAIISAYRSRARDQSRSGIPGMEKLTELEK